MGLEGIITRFDSIHPLQRPYCTAIGRSDLWQYPLCGSASKRKYAMTLPVHGLVNAERMAK